uniref:Transmembrane 6 superfamily member 2 n=1 Tax=Cyprinus carpio TaxID=7962 RepID=A0A8C2GRQ0_CYPCA
MVQETSVFLFSLTALGVLYTLNNVPAFQEGVFLPVVILEIGVAVLVAVFLLVYLATILQRSFGLCILEYDGFTSGFMEFYQKTGEPYLGTPYAIMIVSCHPRQQYCTLGLFWPGSLCANMIVFVPRIVVGKYGSEICPAFCLNMPFLLVPIWGTVFLFSRPRDMPLVGASKAVCEQKKALIWSPLDLLFVVYLVAAMGSTIFKGLVSWCSPYLGQRNSYLYPYRPFLIYEPYLKNLMLLLLFHTLPMLGSFAYGLYTPGCTWMLDWTVYFASAILQCQWSYIGASLHPHTAEMYRIPVTTLVPVLLLNLLYAAGPVLLILHCKREPDYFLSISPVGQSNNEKKLN